jgi:hypothetical protein
MPVQLSQSSAQDMRAIIDANLVTPVPPGAPPAAPVDFCTVWPAAKPVLQVVAGVIGFIPGVGSGAGAALTALIAAGDGIYTRTCTTPTP